MIALWILLGMLGGVVLALVWWGIEENGEPERIYVRPEVLSFAVLMEETLQANDHKGGWQNETNEWLLNKLDEEVAELKAELDETVHPELLGSEAADVANLAMFIADNNGVFKFRAENES